MQPGAGADVDHVVGVSDHVLVVLDHQHGVADVRQVAKGRDQPVVVPLVETDGGFVEDVADAHQSRADLGREPDPLGLAAGERSAGSVERQIVEAHRSEEAESGSDFAEDRLGDGLAFDAEYEVLEEFHGPFDREVRDLGDVEGFAGTVDLDRPGGGLQPRSAAFAALRGRHVTVHAFPHELAVAGLVAATKVRQDAFELQAGLRDHFLGHAVQEKSHGRGGHRRDRCLGIDVERLHELPEEASVVDVHAAAVLPPRLDRAFLQGAGRIRHHERLVEFVDGAQPGAGLARPVRRVEREESGGEFLDRALRMVGAREVLAESVLRPDAVLLHQHEQGAGSDLERGLHALREPLASLGVELDAVDHRLDVVHLVASQFERVLAFLLEDLPQIPDLAVHADSDEALALESFGDLAVESLASSNHRSTDHRPGPGPSFEQQFDDLARVGRGDRIPADLAAVVLVPAGRPTGPGVEEPQVVVDLGGGGDRGARGVAAAALFDRDGGGETVDRLQIGLPHLVEELPRVRGEGLHVLPLALGEDGVEGEGTLARARDARHHHEAVSGNTEVEVLEIVLPSAPDLDRIGGRRGRGRRGHGSPSVEEESIGSVG